MFRPNRTVATIRAQLCPFLFPQAISSHRPMAIRLSTTAMVTATIASLCTCCAVSVDDAFRMTRSMAWKLSTVTIRLTALSAAPVYMSRTAVRTGRGGSDRVGSGGISPPCGKGWYMSAPHQLRRACRTMARGSPGRQRTELSRATVT